MVIPKLTFFMSRSVLFNTETGFFVTCILDIDEVSYVLDNMIAFISL